MSYNLTNVMYAVIILFFAIASTFGVPWLLQIYGAEKLDRVIKLVAIAVKAAEQIYNQSGMGEQKKQWVIKWLQDRGIRMDFDALEALIEAEVQKLNKLIK